MVIDRGAIWKDFFYLVQSSGKLTSLTPEATNVWLMLVEFSTEVARLASEHKHKEKFDRAIDKNDLIVCTLDVKELCKLSNFMKGTANFKLKTTCIK